MQLIHDSGKHNKFWSYKIDTQYSVIVSWGRLGTKGQQRTYEFKTRGEANDFAAAKTLSKKRKGYKEVDKEGMGLKQLQAELVGAGCKIEELSFIKKLKSDKGAVLGHLYQTLNGEALADPNYEPLIYCALRLTGARGRQCLLIDEHKVYSCWKVGTSRWVGSEQAAYVFRLEDIEIINPFSSDLLKRVRKTAPGLVAALIKTPISKTSMPW